MAADKLYIICGHGAGDPGASGGGNNEADLVRLLGKKMKELGGSKVELLDTSKNWYASKLVNSSLKNKVGSNPVLELHLDSAGSSAKGGHVIIKSGCNADAYDKAIASYLEREFPGRSEIIVKRDNLANVNRAATNKINYRLVEVCFITNDKDRNKLINNMSSVATGLLNAFGIGTVQTGGSWVKDSKGWWYKYSGGSYPKNKWEKIGGKWYWFENSGYAACNKWLKISNEWYWFDTTCAAVQNTWKKIGGKWYYFNDSCQALHDCWRKIDGYWYAFEPLSSCAMRKGWFKDDGKWYYLRTGTDNPANGPEGAMLANGSWYIVDKSYSFNSSGVCTNP